MIAARKLGKRYGPLVAVRDVDLDIQRGEVVGLLGQNGAGKTTIMKMITGYLEPTTGTVRVDDVDVLEDRVGVQRRIGYLPENAPLYPEMLVQDYLLWMAALRDLPEQERTRAVARAARATGLEGHMLRPIGQLSKGYRQRVGIAQAIVHEPQVLIFDEPTNGLDPVQIESIRALIRSLSQRSTVLISTHILQEVEAVCDRVLVLIDGRLVADGPLDSLRASPVVLLSLADGTPDVAGSLADIPGVVELRRRGPDEAQPGFEQWEVHYEGERAPTPAIVRRAAELGWIVGAVAPERISLQAAFQRLQAEVALESRSVRTLADKGGRS
jgi:ABC-2 type transport system ATP-binding protein